MDVDLEKIESLIDKAIDEEDFEKVLRLLEERENILKNIDITPSLAERIIERDERRIERIKKMKSQMLEKFFKSKEMERRIEYGWKDRGRSWGRG